LEFQKGFEVILWENKIDGLLGLDCSDDPGGIKAISLNSFQFSVFSFQFQVDPGGIAAISRWLSAATPPERRTEEFTDPSGIAAA
jgi:hypothetical protein